MNEKYSYKNFLMKTLTDTDPMDWNETEVVGSCFAQEEPDTQVFPKGITGVRFVRCNLDNCVVPKECTIEGGTHKRIRIQKDLEDWIVDSENNPIEPVNKATFSKLGLSTSVSALPADTALPISVTEVKRKQLENQLAADIKALEDAAAWR